jgi:hypothetical protein
MSYGLKVLGVSGAVQIDDTFQNMVRIASGSCSGFSNIITVPDQGTFAPQIFVRPWADGQWVGGLCFQSTTQIEILTNYKEYAEGSNAVSFPGGGFDWVAFGTASRQLVDSSTYGMKVFDASGNLTFDSRYEAARTQTVCLITQSGGTETQAYPQYYGFTGWSIRPWINLNTFSRVLFSGDLGSGDYGWYVTTNGTSSIGVRWAETYADGISFRASGTAFQGMAADVSVVRRYTD